MNIRRTATIGSALIVGAIAALASYSHMRGLALRYGQTEVIADLLPISVDGMMVVATIALGDGRRYRWSAWLAFWVGVAASVIANVLAAEPSAIARCISAWPAIAFLLVVEVITRGGRIRALEQPVSSPADVPAAVPATEPVPVPAADVPAVPAAASTPTRTRTAPTKKPRTGTASKTGTAQKPGTRTDAELTEALAAVPREPDGTVPVRRAAAALGTGPDRARKLLAAEGLLRTEPASDTPDPAPVNGRQPQLTT